MQTFEPIVFNIFYWRINKSDGSYTIANPGAPLTPEIAAQSVRKLNEAYSNLNICFNLIGMDTINSTLHHTGSSLGSINSYAQTHGYAKQNAFNVYVPHRLSNGSGQGAYKRTYLAVNDANITGQMIVHELGHNFNLIHTFGNSNQRPHPVNCERVTRNPNDPYYNAGNNGIGDEVIDTNAVPNFYYEQHNYFAEALEQANIGYNWYQAWPIAFRENGFNDLTNALDIEQALIDYGFTQTEINHLKYNAAVDYAYSDKPNCSYAPDNRKFILGSPFFKDCGGTPYQVLEADVRNYMSYFHSSCKNLFSIGQRIRVREAIEEDLNGEFEPAMSEKTIDLYIRDTETDIGQEPNIHTSVFWNSKDIWVRNQNDGMLNQEHQNPVYNPTNSNYVYVKVRNKGCGNSSGNDQLKLYWAKANTALDWDVNWNGSLYVEGVLMGDEIATLPIPAVPSDQEAILEFEWPVPNPQDYVGINPNPWHFCLLARIESMDDPMTFPEGTFITDNVKNNNNIAWKNTTIIQIKPHTLSVGGVIGVSNPKSLSKAYSLELIADPNEPGKAIYNEAEIGIEMDQTLYDAWVRGAKNGANYASTSNEKKVLASGNNVLLDDIMFNANEYETAYITFNFLTKELSDKQEYTYQVIQRDKATNKIIGGETFEIRKQPRGGFSADAGNNREIERNETITIDATDINENAVYNWYDPDGNLIFTGTSLTISPAVTQQYHLEIISDLDGLKDYDEILVTVKPYRIESLTPNPVASQLTIDYIVAGAASAYVMILNQSTATSDNYILDTINGTISLDLTSYPTGLFSVILVCDGQIQDIKNLAKH